MKLVNFIVCDDIRNEVGNKVSLMGIYDNAITFHVPKEKADKWPKRIRLAFYTKIKFTDPHTKENVNSFTLRMVTTNNEEQLLSGILTQKKSDILSIALVKEGLTFKFPGTYEFYIDFFDQVKQKIETLKPDYTIDVNESLIHA